MLIATFFDNVFSKQFALKLRASSESLGIKCRIFNRSARPGLEGKSGWKPDALLELMKGYPADDVFLVDAESVLNRRPDILLDEKDFDAALYFDVETLAPSGPLFLRNNERARRMMNVWSDLNRALPENSDAENLSRVLSHPLCPLEVRRLPLTYAWVERLHRQRYPTGRPVLTHFWTDGLISTRIQVAQ
ncbi:MAG TPA: hypothetical protein VKW04_11560 [Planctomycetota bacterium]|nr:hypothetical protein [Planctomycetota bacterium]